MEKEKIYLVMHCRYHDDYAQPSFACSTKEKAEEDIGYILAPHNVIVENERYINTDDRREWCTIEEMEIDVE